MDNPPHEGGPRSRVSLLVRNLNFHSSPDDVRTAFSEFGPIRDVYLPLDFHTGEPRGFGFVEFESSKDAYDAMYSLHNTVFQGSTIHVTIAKKGRSDPMQMRRREMRGDYEREGGRRSGRYYSSSRYRSSRSPPPYHHLSRAGSSNSSSMYGYGSKGSGGSWGSSPSGPLVRRDFERSLSRGRERAYRSRSRGRRARSRSPHRGRRSTSYEGGRSPYRRRSIRSVSRESSGGASRISLSATLRPHRISKERAPAISEEKGRDLIVKKRSVSRSSRRHRCNSKTLPDGSEEGRCSSSRHRGGSTTIGRRRDSTGRHRRSINSSRHRAGSSSRSKHRSSSRSKHRSSSRSKHRSTSVSKHRGGSKSTNSRRRTSSSARKSDSVGVEKGETDFESLHSRRAAAESKSGDRLSHGGSNYEGSRRSSMSRRSSSVLRRENDARSSRSRSGAAPLTGEKSPVASGSHRGRSSSRSRERDFSAVGEREEDERNPFQEGFFEDRKHKNIDAESQNGDDRHAAEADEEAQHSSRRSDC